MQGVGWSPGIEFIHRRKIWNSLILDNAFSVSPGIMGNDGERWGKIGNDSESSGKLRLRKLE